MVGYKRCGFNNVTPDNDGKRGLKIAHQVRIQGSFEGDSTPLFRNAQTNELFVKYEFSLIRNDFLNSKQFVCESTGREKLTYAQAKKSEKYGGLKDLDVNMVETLKMPILRKVQFSRIQNSDELVNWIYDEYKDNLFPGENVKVRLGETAKEYDGYIREKTSLPPLIAADGSVERPAISRYFVSLNNGTEALVDNQHVFRPRRNFSRAVLRSFLRHTLVRPQEKGGVWNIKEDIAKNYGIDTTLPRELDPKWLQEQAKAKKQAMKLQNVVNNHDMPSPDFLRDLAAAGKLPGHPASKPLTDKDIAKWERKYRKALANGNQPPFPIKAGAVNGLPGQFADMRVHGKVTLKPPPPKYPIEDLDVPARKPTVVRPKLKFLAHAHQFNDALAVSVTDKIDQPTTGVLLETWNTLSVFSYFFCLDSFVFDDFVEAMLISSEDMHCELFEEIHCAVLKTIVNEDGEVLNKTLAALKDPNAETTSEEEEEEEEDGEEEENPATPVKETVIQATPSRRSARKMMADAAKEAAQTNGNGEHDPDDNRIEDLLEPEEWSTRLAERRFARGGWQTIVTGLIEKLGLKPANKTICDKILAQLVPRDEDPTEATVRANYGRLDLFTRTTILQMMLLLTIETKPFKDFMDNCMRDLTDTRKHKVQYQSQKKPLVKRLLELQEQRKLLNPDGMIDDVEMKVEEEDEEDEDSALKQDSDAEEEQDEDEEPTDRRKSGRASHLKRKREEESKRKEKEKKTKVENDEKAKFEQVLEEIEEVKEEIQECEENITYYEDLLRENSCHRTKVLGLDRFMNRYYWYERNGMQFGGDDGSSTAHYDYMNARIWVQGPVELDRKALIDLPAAEQQKYKEANGMTVPKRKKTEEGETSLMSSDDFGYYDNAADLDALIAWLDDRGNREKSLRKELKNWRDRIAEYMGHMQAHLDEVASKRAVSEEPAIGIATRKRNYIDQNASKHPCLAWRNGAALERIGQLHSDGPVATKKGRRGMAIRTQAAEKEANVAPSTRSGMKYRGK